MTCEEIDENSLSDFLNGMDNEILIILTGELGKSMMGKMKDGVLYHSQIDSAVDMAGKCGAKNILLIFRSNYSDLGRR
ncbi:hypothetical protein [Methanobacterium petrolearium]|uniref:hypothetical protein n=1 Tax=Methanobacterium petrolearium TaxID=710190 RepID=UPI003081A118|nr:hypothetical protein GCM10025861_11140 [Methanobacterium petrolearium]